LIFVFQHASSITMGFTSLLVTQSVFFTPPIQHTVFLPQKILETKLYKLLGNNLIDDTNFLTVITYQS